MKPLERQIRAAKVAAAVVTALTIAGACGSKSPTNPSPGNGPVGATITITSAGVNPKTVTINTGEVVMVTNSDTRNHQIASNPHPAHTDCVQINALSTLTPGQSRNTANFTSSRTCGFHDHLDDTNAAFQGTITIR